MQGIESCGKLCYQPIEALAPALRSTLPDPPQLRLRAFVHRRDPICPEVLRLAAVADFWIWLQLMKQLTTCQ